MLKPRALKGFIFAFLLILAGGLVFVGSAPLGLSNNPLNIGAATVDDIGAVIMFFGLLIGLVACGL